MGFNSLNLKTEQNEHEKKITGEFMREQIRMPEESWSPEFRIFVQNKIAETIEYVEHRKRVARGEEVDSTESRGEDTFNRYLQELGLQKDELRGKRIMDLGFGHGDFVKYLISEGISSDAYGVDIHEPMVPIEDEFKSHLFIRSMEEDLPVKDLDYILSIQAIWPEDTWNTDHPMNIETILEKSLSALKAGGEIRIFPIDEGAKRNTNTEGIKEAEKAKKIWDSVLPVMTEKYGLEHEIKPIDIFPHNDGDVTLQSVLIIRKPAK